MKSKNTVRTIPEPNKEVNIIDECDVVVVGGGPGGIELPLQPPEMAPIPF